MESVTQNQLPHVAASHLPVTQTPTMQQEAAPKPAHHKTPKQLNFPFFENYMKMARFNSSEQEVLERCLIPSPTFRHRSSLSNSTVTKSQGIDSMSHLLDLDDDYLLKTLEGDSDFSDSISAISSLSISSSKRKKKRSERWRTNSRRASANALIIMKHEETHQHSTEQNMHSSEKVSSQHSDRALQQHTPRQDDMSDGEERRSHHSIPRSHRSNHSHHGRARSLHSSTRSHHSSAHSQHSNHSFHGSHSAAPTRGHVITTESEEKTTTSWSDRIVNADNDNFQQDSNCIKSSRPLSANRVRNDDAVEGHSRPSSGGQRRGRSVNSQAYRRHSDSESDSGEQQVFEEENNTQGEKVQGRSRYRDKEGHSRHRERKKESYIGENEKENRRRRSNPRKERSGRGDHREEDVREGDCRVEQPRGDHVEERSRGRHKRRSRHRRDKDNSGSSNDQILPVEYNEKLGRNMRATARKERRKLND